MYMEQVHFRGSEKYIKELKQIAKEKDCTFSELIRRAIEEFVIREKEEEKRNPN